MGIDTFLVSADTNVEKVVNCSVIDKQLKDLVVSVVFFYRESVNLDLLIESLRKALSSFPVFSGRIVSKESNLSIDCNNAGVSLCKEDIGGTLEWGLNAFVKTNGYAFVDELNLRKTLSSKSPVLSLKISYFSAGGMAVGASWNHAVGDMCSFLQFMGTWANITAGNTERIEKPVIPENRDQYLHESLSDRSSAQPTIKELKGKDIVKLVLHRMLRCRGMRALTFYFSDEELAEMQAVFSENANQALSINDVVCAHMFSVLVDKDNSDTPRCLSVAVDFRRREGLPRLVVGNLLSAINLELDQGLEPWDYASQLRRAVDNFSIEHFDYFANARSFNEALDRGRPKQWVPKALDPANGNMLVTNWANQNLDDICFGKEKPYCFFPVGDVPFPWIAAIVKGPNGEGLVFKVTLPKELSSTACAENGLSKIHRYRRADTVLSKESRQISWLL